MMYRGSRPHRKSTVNTLCANMVSTCSSIPNAAGKYSGGSMTNRYAVAPNQSARVVGSPLRRQRRIANTSASTDPSTIVNSRTGSVQFSRANGLRSSTSPPASAHEKPSAVDSWSKVGEQRSIIS